MDLEFRPISENDKLQGFDCGVESLNSFLINHSLINQLRRLSITTIAYRKEDIAQNVVGYYTLCPAQVDAASFPKKIARGLPNYPIPAIRLCRLAVALHYQRQKCGQELLVHALLKCYQLSSDLGGFCVVVDAINEHAQHFYEKFGFNSFIDQPRALFLPMKLVKEYISL